MHSRPTALLLVVITAVGASWFTLTAGQSRGSATPVGVASWEDKVRLDLAGEEGAERLFQDPLLHDGVKSQVDYLTTSQRALFQKWLDRSVRYLPLMKEIFREYALPEDLVYLAMIESGFNPHAVSRRRAVGLWQFMRLTGREYGLITDKWIDERKDPVKSTRVAAAYLKDLYGRFGAWPLALASYNAGPGRVQRALRRSGSYDYWGLRATRHFRQETRNYVPQYIAALIIAKNPDVFGFTVPSAGAFQYDEIVVKQSTDLGTIARYVGCSFDDIMELNPELVGRSTPPLNHYVLRVPKGARIVREARAARLFRELAALREPMEKESSLRPSFLVHAAPEDGIFDSVCSQNFFSSFGGPFANAADITC